MAFPASLTLVTVHGRFDTPPNGGAAGVITFTMHRPLLGPTDDSIVPPFEASGVLDAAGEFTVSLPATNDPQWAPQNWAYTVVARLSGGAVLGTLQLDYQTTSVELADLLQVDGAAVPGETYIRLSQRSIAGGVAGLDSDGDVIDASGAKITGGGGGGGASPSSTVVAGTSFGASSTAGVASSYSRGDHSHGTPAAQTLASLGAAATVHTHTASQISDSTTVGRAVVTAADAAAGRTAIGAGTSSLALGSSSSTAAAGDHTHTGTYQPVDADLTTIAGLTATTGNFMVAQSSAWASVTPATAKTALAIAESDVANLTTDLAAKAPLASPTFTGTPSLPTGTTGVTQTAGNSTTALATTAFVTTADALKAPLASPALTGTPTAPTAAAATNTTQLATTAFATGAVADHVAAGDPHTQYLLESTATTKGDLLVATGSAAITRLPIGSNTQVLTADSTQTSGMKWASGGGGGTTVVTRRGYVSSGDIVPQTTASFAALTSGPTFSIPAVAGDEIVFDWSALKQPAAGLFWDLAVLVSGSPVRYASTGTGTPAIEGDPSLYPDNSFRPESTFGMAFVAASGDISGGNVTIGVAVLNPSGGGKLFAGTAYPLRWHLINFGPQS